VGSNEKIIAEWVDTLSLFLLPHQRNIARSKVEQGKEYYIPDLALQGVICNFEDISKELRKSTCSTTILILNHQETPTPNVNGELHTPNHNLVRQYYPLNETSPLKTEFKNTEELLLRSVETSQEVNDIIEKILRVEGNFVKQGYISQMMSLLLRRAMVLLKYVEAMPMNMESSEVAPEPRNRDEAPESPPITPREPKEEALSRETKKRIRNDLGLREDTCFNLLLGIAEKLKPGIYYTVVGNQAWIEEKLIELFERF